MAWNLAAELDPPDVASYHSDYWSLLAGIHMAMSSDGTKVAAYSEGVCDQGRIFAWEFSGGVWYQRGFVQPPWYTIWSDSFDGTTVRGKLTQTPGAGSISEAGGLLTITAPASAAEWTTCPMAWRCDNTAEGLVRETTITSFPATADIFAGITAFGYEDGISLRQYAHILELFYDGAYKVRAAVADEYTIVPLGDALTVTNPAADPLQLRLIYSRSQGISVFFAKNASESDWHEVHFDSDYYEWAMSSGLFVRNVGTHPGGAVSFSDMGIKLFSYDMDYGMVAVEGDTLIAGYGRAPVDMEQVLSVEADTPQASAGYGSAVAIGFDEWITGTNGGGNTYIFVGAPGEDSGQGAVHVHRRNAGSGDPELFQLLTADDGAAGDAFGTAVHAPVMATNWGGYASSPLVVGAPEATVDGHPGAGAVYVFERTTGAANLYTQTHKFVSPTPVDDGHFGRAVRAAYYFNNSLTPKQRDTVWIGEPGAGGTAGALHAFRRLSGGSWALLTTRTASDGAAGDAFGSAIFYAAYLECFVGAPGDGTNTGSVYRYVGAGDPPTWTQSKIVAPDGVAGDLFGTAGAYGSDTEKYLVVGAPGRTGGKGAAYVFRYTTVFTYETTFAPAYLETGDRFGIAINSGANGSDGHFLIGADGDGVHQGYAVDYYNDDLYKGAWVELGKVVSSTANATERYGAALAAESVAFVIAAPSRTVGGQTGAGACDQFYHDRFEVGNWWQGALFVFKEQLNHSWLIDQIIRSPAPVDGGTAFGAVFSLSKDKSTLVVGPSSDPTRIYKLVDGKYEFFQALQADDEYEKPYRASYYNSGGPGRRGPGYSLGAAVRTLAVSQDGGFIAMADDRALLHYWGCSYYRNSAQLLALPQRVPNPSCSITFPGSFGGAAAQFNLNTGGGTADWDGGGICTCPILYKTPMPFVLSELERKIRFESQLSIATGYTAALGSVYSGLALYTDPTTDAIIWEYNRQTPKMHLWVTTGGGAKQAIFTSPALTGTYAWNAYLLYDPETNSVTPGYGFTDYAFNYVLPFVPTNFAIFGRIASPTTGTARTNNDYFQTYTPHPGAIRAYSFSGGVYSETDLVKEYPEDAPNDSYYHSFGYLCTSMAMSRDGNWVAHVGGAAGNAVQIYHQVSGQLTFDVNLPTPGGGVCGYGVCVLNGTSGKPILVITDRSDWATYIYRREGAGDWQLQQTIADGWDPVDGSDTASRLALAAWDLTVEEIEDVGAQYIYEVDEVVLPNLSFERADTQKGAADNWPIGESFYGIIPAIFCADAEPPTDWDPWESNERQWRLPYVVHNEVDPGHAISAPAAGNLAEAITLANELRADLNGHMLLKGYTHLQSSPHSLIEINDATEVNSLVVMANAVKAAYNAHLDSTAHFRLDTPNYVSTANATDEGTAITLANALRTAYIAHRIQIGFGHMNENALFELTDADISRGTFHDALLKEGFEFGWAIGDMLATKELQELQVSTDDSALWPIGHVELLDKLENLVSQPANAGVPEDFEIGWYLPGDNAVHFPNDYMWRRYKVGGTWNFPDDRLQQGIADSFETGWGADTFFARYWSGTEWRFVEDTVPPTRQIVCRGFGYRAYGSLDMATGIFTSNGNLLPGSDVMWVTTTSESEALPDSNWLQFDFMCMDGNAHSVFVYLISSTTPPDKIWLVGHEENKFQVSPEISAASLSFESQFMTFRQVQSGGIGPDLATGVVEVRGGKDAIEDFEEEWTLTL